MAAFTPISTSVTFSVDVHDVEPVKDKDGNLFVPADCDVRFLAGEFRSVYMWDAEADRGVRFVAADGRDEMPEWLARLINDMRPAAQAAANRGPF